MKLQLSLICLFALATCSMQAAWTNSGTMNFKDSTFNISEFENNGTLICAGDSALGFTKLMGDGLIQVTNGHTVIKAKEFLFDGTIECDGECDIYTSTPADAITCKQQGSGRITIHNN